MKCRETVWLPGPPQTKFSGPHYCEKEPAQSYKFYFGKAPYGLQERILCEEHRQVLIDNGYVFV